jgi:hypothetical protein
MLSFKAFNETLDMLTALQGHSGESQNLANEIRQNVKNMLQEASEKIEMSYAALQALKAVSNDGALTAEDKSKDLEKIMNAVQYQMASF